MNKKKKIIIIIILFLCLVILGLLILFLTKDLRISKEEKVVRKLTSMGEEIYNDYYYPQISSKKTDEEITSFLKVYEEIGLKFTLSELEKYSDEFNDTISKYSDDYKCDKDNTMVIIYPNSPYGQTDYTLQIKLECEF